MHYLKIICGKPFHNTFGRHFPEKIKRKIHLRWSLKNGNWDHSFKSTVESKANVNGTWGNSLHSKNSLALVAKKRDGNRDYSFKSIVESKANVNGTWDNSLHSKIHLGWSLKNGTGTETTRQLSLFKISLALVAKKRDLRLHFKSIVERNFLSTRNWELSSFCAFINDQQTIFLRRDQLLEETVRYLWFKKYVYVKWLSSEWRIYLCWNFINYKFCLDLHADISSDHFYIKYIFG